MKYEECPYCGAHLDHGEMCDCEEAKKERDEPGATGSSQKRILELLSNIAQAESHVKACTDLPDIINPKRMSRDAIIKCVKKEFPSFSTILLTQCLHWEKYGIIIHPTALRKIVTEFGADDCKQQKKSHESKSRPNKLTVRVPDNVMEKMRKCMERIGIKTIQEFVLLSIVATIDAI
ncbi:MAG: hypothetical protein MJY95_08275 [Bacteroidaceae bacterium]|nr:hypothetical protein [Bacteroidaceae bacterium]